MYENGTIYLLMFRSLHLKSLLLISSLFPRDFFLTINKVNTNVPIHKYWRNHFLGVKQSNFSWSYHCELDIEMNKNLCWI
jgi:hypothetical protein